MFLSDRIAGQPVQTLYIQTGDIENIFETKCPTHYPLIYPSDNSLNCYYYARCIFSNLLSAHRSTESSVLPIIYTFKFMCSSSKSVHIIQLSSLPQNILITHCEYGSE
jgi:hypothetical protein